MADVFGWGTIVLVLSVPVVFIGSAFATRRRDDASQPSSGGLLGFDELFHPAAHNARLTWEVEQELPVPAPSPDKGPGVIDAGRRIVIEIDPQQ
ncbi:hypothetical protein [Microbacterium paludicola]|jgi:hypothetical protein|uniref:hypothetical protein n=1 Tax=Microbacterium paludicola TaxID=300019 RepID=UPI0009035133|nr:hypothetical protein [Microbacterium paludicola]APF34757.1 hypothetical protein BO218_11655 [Microbacterium paludicola]